MQNAQSNTLTATRHAADSRESTFKTTTRGMRLMLFVASALVFSVGVPLFLLTEQTDVYFAWTIQSPLTAAFLGAAYWASFALELLAGRETVWARARAAVPSVLIFTALTLLVTLLHIDRFHFNAPALLTRVGTGVWLAVYALVPLVMGVLLVRQMREPGGDPPRVLPLPAWLRAVLAVQAAVMVTLGVALLLAPLAVAPLWPWTLTALTGRAAGAWLIGLGIATAHNGWENDATRTQPVFVSSVLFSLLQFIALARYGGEMRWDAAGAWVYVLFLVSFVLVGAYGIARGRSAV